MPATSTAHVAFAPPWVMETYDLVLHDALESEPEAAVLTGIFFLAVTFTNTFVLLGLYLAVIANTFKA